MGQIVGGAAKPNRCNLDKLSQLGVPAAGEHILVSSDNSMNAAGQGNFDCYIEGNGTDAATALELKPINPKEAQLYTEMYGGVKEITFDTTASYIDIPLADVGVVVGVDKIFSFYGSATLASSFTQRINGTNGSNQDVQSLGNNQYKIHWTNNQNPNCDTMRFWLNGDRSETSHFVFYGDTIVGLKERFEEFLEAMPAAIEAEAEAREAGMDNLYDNVLPKAFITKEATGTSFVLTDHVAGLPLISLNQDAFIHNSNLLDVDLFNPTYAQESTKSFLLKGYANVLMTNANILKTFKTGTQYTLSFDFEVLETPNGSASAYYAGFIIGIGSTNPAYTASQFVAGFTGHVSASFTLSSPFTGVMYFYTGGSGDLVEVRFSNVRIVEGTAELPWEEADNIDFVVGDAMPVLVSTKEWIDADAEATIIYKTSNEELVGKVAELGSTIEKAFNTKRTSGTYIALTDHIVGLPLVSLDQNAFIHNTNIISPDLFEAEYGITNTRSFTLHGKAKYLITHANIIKVLRLHTYYYFSCDYEIKSVDAVATTNRVGFTWGFVDLPASEFVVGKTGHIGLLQGVTDQANLDSKSLVFYTGTNGQDSLATVEFKNFRIVVGKSELPWEEADNIFFEVGDEMPVLNNEIEIIQPDAYADVEYYVKSGSGTAFIANQFVKCINHRGYSQLAPEDTEPAYVYSKKMGFLYGENDLWFTSDGVPVMVHARDLSLMTDGTGNVDEVTFSYFKSLDFGQGATYGNKYDGLKGLSFDEWILLMKTLGMTPFIDTKAISPEPVGGDSVVLLKSILDKYNMTDKVIWAIGWTGAARLRTIMPNAKVGFTLSSTPTDQEIADCADYLIDNDPDTAFIFVDTNHLTASVVERCHAAGVGCYAWKADATIIDNPDEVVGYVKLGIDGLCSDGANLTKDVDDYYYDLYDVE